MFYQSPQYKQQAPSGAFLCHHIICILILNDNIRRDDTRDRARESEYDECKV
jgi:hypothetical protein